MGLPRHVNKDATSINDFTNRILAKRRLGPLPHHHPPISARLLLRTLSSSSLLTLNPYFFNLFLILICALTFFCNELFFFCRSRRMLPNHRSSWITFNQSYYWDFFVSKNRNYWTVSKENDDFIDIFV